MAKPGDIVDIHGEWCLVFRDRDTGLIRNVIITGLYYDDECKTGMLIGGEIDEYPVLFSLRDVLTKVQDET